MSQKICVISFDQWDYDHHIVKTLREKKIDAFHIKIKDFKHETFFARITNTLSKVFLNNNPKKIKRQDYILKKLEKKGFQDQILIINPELIDTKYHLEIKKHTHKYIAYLYDSVNRCSIEHLLDGIFDEIYSFDKNDIKQYNFKESSNYIYFKQKYALPKPTIDFIYLGSIDNRIAILNKMAKIFNKTNKKYQLYAIGKKAIVYKIKQFLLRKNKNIFFKTKKISQETALDLYKQSNIIIDIVRENQIGLSFRIFEAMALGKKIITNNHNIALYNFYNPNNIFIWDEKTTALPSSFIKAEYQRIPNEIYLQYTIDTWVENIFQLKKHN
ncbi:MAG: hypothetical protein QG594_1946 [Bacteroidota bacterium]|nr:hypothetical protein [Bacteroidota bacterium]